MADESAAYIITLPPPTPNGGIHVGHMSGPFLAGDIFAKAMRMSGARTFTTCYSDVNQSYVRVTAEKQNRDPGELSSYWTKEIERTLRSLSIGLDDYFSPDIEGSVFIRQLFCDLYERGVLVKKHFPFFKSRSTGLVYDEAGVSGTCPHCLSSCKCGICESCGNLTRAGELLKPRSTNDGSTELEITHEEVLVLELEKFRSQITDFYDGKDKFRTRYLWLIDDAMRGPLPDFPITLPSSWGIKIEHKDFPNQTINAWPEIMAQLIYSYQRASRSDAVTWDPAHLVNFFGYDNSYFYALTHVALLHHIDGGRWLPHATMINEFHNLDHSKFSTSNNHVIWASDLLKRHSVDSARFFAAFNNPGMEKANFNEGEMSRVTREKLTEPWRRIVKKFNNIVDIWDDRPMTVSADARRISEVGLARIHRSYTLERFHLRQACEDILHFQACIEGFLSESADSAALGDVAHMLCEFSRAAYPVMPNGCSALFSTLTGSALPKTEPAVELKKTRIPTDLFE